MKTIKKKVPDVICGDYLVVESSRQELSIALKVTFIEKGNEVWRFWGGRNDPLLGSEDFWVSSVSPDQEVEIADLSDIDMSDIPLKPLPEVYP